MTTLLKLYAFYTRYYQVEEVDVCAALAVGVNDTTVVRTPRGVCGYGC